MASRKPKDDDLSLPFAALQLLAPPVRVVSAALWKVLQQRDVMQYGVVEEFVTSACETVPGLLTSRHQGRLALGLRARLILELCSVQPDVKVIQPHLERIRAPASASTVKKDVKIVHTVEQFHAFVHTLLTEPAEREHFFKEEFPVEYGPTFDRELEKLLWEFLIRLDQLLPVPSLQQTASWLRDAPPVLEECAQAATQPQLLEILLKHQTCLGHLEAAASLPPNMGDSILTSMSLPPSGRVRKSPSDQCQGKAPITPVFGLISNEDVPIMRTLQKESQSFTSIRYKPEAGGSEAGCSPRGAGTKRKQPEEGERESSEGEEEAAGPSRPANKKKSRQRARKSTTTTEARGAKAAGDGSCSNKIPAASAAQRPQHASLSAAIASCLSSQPRVVVERLSMQAVLARSSFKGEAASPSHKQQRRKSPVKAQRRPQRGSHQTPESQSPGLDDKENRPLSPSVSSSAPRQRVATEALAPGEGDDYVADSEDEATKNFKGRLFTKRYYKTKHGTYVPTLREFWKPGASRCSFLSTSSKNR
ncbi:TERF1-interacting nuclear factor 2 [Salarias fasciatus]|uniref:TERF1-interacting nuclear factor 2 n=1 Tax=Salarias fasciatus TaxID=181472 RepID=UPI001176EEEE|nr:uncharacterized protein LOC115386253 [Salarias fasciatus]